MITLFFKPFIGKAKMACQAVLKFLRAVCLWRHTLLIHFVKIVLKWLHRNLRCALHVLEIFSIIFFISYEVQRDAQVSYACNYAYGYPCFILCIEFHSDSKQTRFCHSCTHVVEGNQRNIWAVSGYTRSLGRLCGCCAVRILTVLLILLGECLYEITIDDHRLSFDFQ
jgi:hypothetical protein